MADDHIQHGIDDDPNNDPQKGAAIGGVGGAVVGGAAGSMLGPVGAVIGAVVGGVAGAAASGAAVAAVDSRDNDDNMTGLGDDIDIDDAPDTDYAATPIGTTGAYTGSTYDANATRALDRDLADDLEDDNDYAAANTPGIQTGGFASDGTPDTRGITEKTSDAVTGDRIDDKTGRPVF